MSGRWQALRSRPDRVAFAVVLAGLIAANFRRPVRLSPDSHTYAAWAEHLIRLRFDWVAYLQQNDFVAPAEFYLLPVTLIALLKAGFDGQWVQAFFALNLACVAALLFMFGACARRLQVHPGAIALGYMALGISTDLLIWPHYALTDTLYASLMMGFVWVLLTISAGRPRAPTWVGLASCVLVLGLSRPAAPALLPAVLVALWLPALERILQSRFALMSAAAIVLCGAAGLYGWLITHLPSVWPGVLNSRQWKFITDHVTEGGVIHHRLGTYLNAPEGTWDVAGLYLTRWLFFFSPHSERFSAVHTAANLVFALVVAAGIVCVIRQFEVLTSPMRRSLLILLAVIGGTACFHSAILIDYDWRYRFPIIAPIVLVAVMGFSAELRARRSNSQRIRQRPTA